MATSSVGLPKFQALDSNGNPLAGGKLYTSISGGNTPATTYTSEDASTPNTNPIVLDARGEADIWLQADVAYRFRLTDAADVPIWTIDDVTGDVGSVALAAPSGAQLVGFIQAGAGAVARTVQDKERDVISVFDFMTAAQIADARSGTPLIDSSAAVQAAFDHCLSTTRPKTLVVPGLILLGSPIIADRPLHVQVADLIVRGEAGGGFYVNSDITMFDSSISMTDDPVSVGLIFDTVHFEASSAALAAYVMSGKFLINQFRGCRFEKIKCVATSVYAQSWRFARNYIRNWQGYFFSSAGSYDVGFAGDLFEQGGAGFKSVHPTNSHPTANARLHGVLFQGCDGPFVESAQEVALSVVGNYTEGNDAPDYQFARNGSFARGITFDGNFQALSSANATNPAFYNVLWGGTDGASSRGNWCNGNMHDTTGIGSVGLSMDGSDVAVGELFKGAASGHSDPARSPVGNVRWLEGRTAFFGSGSGYIGIDPLISAFLIGPGELQSGSLVPIRFLFGQWNPGTHNAFYGDPYWTVGSRVVNIAPASGQPKGWVCTVSGQPGTWVSEGDL